MKHFSYFYNATILTMDDANPCTHHMLTCNGTIVYAGNDRAPLSLDSRDADFSRVRASLSQDVEFIDLKGSTVIPGFCDSHMHIGHTSHTIAMADLTSARTEDEAVALMQQHAKKINAKPGDWIRGHGWTHNFWPGEKTPTRHSLDKAFPDNPLYLTSKCLHLGWVNTCAIKTCGLTKDTPCPVGGSFAIEPSGELSGYILEDAVELVEKCIPELTAEQLKNNMIEVQKIAHSFGLTALNTPDTKEDFMMLQELNNEGKLDTRIVFHPRVSMFEEVIDAGLKSGLGDDFLRIGGIKILMDGSLGGHTAYMYEPYENEPENYGQTVEDPDKMIQVTMAANAAGFPMVIHAIGDKAIGMVLRAYEKVQRLFPEMTGRNSIEHLQVISEKDLPLLEQVRPIAGVQPVHLCADLVPADKFWGKRARLAYAFRTIANAGCTLAFGSDCPVEPMNPFYGLHAAVNRQSLEDKPEAGWYPDERLTIMESLKAFTKGGAIAGGVITAARRGELAEGKLADFVVLDENPLTMPSTKLRTTLPQSIWVGAKCVYHR